ncbi:MAG: signal recognition particle-docking protein FtsY [Armatimonadetes bacterium]|nr:signal recognition particle-docking protein FtsY [Armatimonadota bacterium]
MVVLKGLFSKVTHVLRGTRKIDDDLLDDLEEALVQADVSAKLAMRLVEELKTRAENTHVEDAAGLENVLRQMIHNMLRPLEKPLNTGPTAPTVFLIAGVNGVGKTTSIAKIGHWYRSHGNDVVFIAADTYRAAAADQLDVWARRVNCDIVRQQPGADPGAVVHDGLQAALSRNANLVIIDTAGRLHTKVNLMEELKKVVRVVERVLGRPPDESLLILDATTGQNGLNQARVFHEAIDITGLMIAKLDGTAKGGIVLTIADQLGIPIKLIGLGEKPESLALFETRRFVADLFERNGGDEA